MTADKILDSIIAKKCYFQELHHLPNEKIGCIVSSNNANILINFIYLDTDIEIPKTVSGIKIYGMRMFPSDFLSNDYFGIFEIKPL